MPSSLIRGKCPLYFYWLSKGNHCNVFCKWLESSGRLPFELLEQKKKSWTGCHHTSCYLLMSWMNLICSSMYQSCNKDHWWFWKSALFIGWEPISIINYIYTRPGTLATQLTPCKLAYHLPPKVAKNHGFSISGHPPISSKNYRCNSGLICTGLLRLYQNWKENEIKHKNIKEFSKFSWMYFKPYPMPIKTNN